MVIELLLYDIGKEKCIVMVGSGKEFGQCRSRKKINSLGKAIRENQYVWELIRRRLHTCVSANKWINLFVSANLLRNIFPLYSESLPQKL